MYINYSLLPGYGVLVLLKSKQKITKTIIMITKVYKYCSYNKCNMGVLHLQ